MDYHLFHLREMTGIWFMKAWEQCKKKKKEERKKERKIAHGEIPSARSAVASLLLSRLWFYSEDKWLRLFQVLHSLHRLASHSLSSSILLSSLSVSLSLSVSQTHTPTQASTHAHTQGRAGLSCAYTGIWRRIQCAILGWSWCLAVLLVGSTSCSMSLWTLSLHDRCVMWIYCLWGACSGNESCGGRLLRSTVDHLTHCRWWCIRWPLMVTVVHQFGCRLFAERFYSGSFCAWSSRLCLFIVLFHVCCWPFHNLDSFINPPACPTSRFEATKDGHPNCVWIHFWHTPAPSVSDSPSVSKRLCEEHRGAGVSELLEMKRRKRADRETWLTAEKEERSREEDWMLRFMGRYRTALRETNERLLIRCSRTASQMYF